ncbi:hypothetical protein L1887_16602 [Cichorium endivia]|nr:hypothetical protein L1887_16602 [Cichorium endivia]
MENFSILVIHLSNKMLISLRHFIEQTKQNSKGIFPTKSMVAEEVCSLHYTPFAYSSSLTLLLLPSSAAINFVHSNLQISSSSLPLATCLHEELKTRTYVH